MSIFNPKFYKKSYYDIDEDAKDFEIRAKIVKDIKDYAYGSFNGMDFSKIAKDIMKQTEADNSKKDKPKSKVRKFGKPKRK